MTINLKIPDIHEMKPRITVFGVGGAGGNAVNNMISAGLQGVDFVVANTDAQALTMSKAERIVQMGAQVTEGLGAGSQPEVGRAAAEEVIDEIRDHLSGAHMVFVTAGMGGGTGTGASPVVAKIARELGILTVGVVTKPFHFEGQRRMRYAEAGIVELQKVVDTLLIIPNQNLFRVANEKTTFADAFAMADQVLYSGVACITDLMVKEGLINLDFADVRAVMKEMGKAMMGTGEATGEKRALTAAEAAIANPLIDDASMKGARGLLISITGGKDLTLYEVDEAATRIREEVDQDANIIVGATFDESLEGIIRVSVVATGIDHAGLQRQPVQPEAALKELAGKLRSRQPPHRRPHRAHPGAAPAPAPVAPGSGCRQCGGGRIRRPRRGRRRTAAADRHRGGLDPADADEAVAVRAGAGRTGACRTADAEGLHPAAARADGGAHAAHAAHRRIAAAGAERDPAQRGEIDRGSSRAAPHVADAAAGLGRARPARRGGGAAAGSAHRPGDAAVRAADAADRRASRKAGRTTRYRNMPGGRRRRDSTPTAGPRLCIIRPRRTSSTSRPSCAARPTERPVKKP